MRLAMPAVAILSLVAVVARAQDPPASAPPPANLERLVEAARARREAVRAETEGVPVRIKEIARFRGVRSNQLQGIGLVIGLEGTGDTKKTPYTATLVANALRNFGNMIDPSALDAKNVAAVWVTAEMPPFASPGNRIDVTVNSIGDCKSLQGGTLIQTPLYAVGDNQTVYALAMGSVSIGGFNVAQGGNRLQKNHVNVGYIPGGATIERSAPTQILFDQDRFFLELETADFTTARRIADVIREHNPAYQPFAVDPGTVQLTLPSGIAPVEAMSEIEALVVRADTEGMVVVDERTGTITWSGNVRLGPAVVVHGALHVIIESEVQVSQPPPFSGGTTVVTQNSAVGAQEDEAQVALIPPNATIADLAKVFQVLRVTPRDVIAILHNLKAQGSLKARLRVK